MKVLDKFIFTYECMTQDTRDYSLLNFVWFRAICADISKLHQ